MPLSVRFRCRHHHHLYHHHHHHHHHHAAIALSLLLNEHNKQLPIPVNITPSVCTTQYNTKLYNPIPTYIYQSVLTADRLLTVQELNFPLLLCPVQSPTRGTEPHN
jgi:hypothetical protein